MRRLDEKVNVRALDADMNDAERAVLGPVKLAAGEGDGRAAECMKHRATAQRVGRAYDPQDNVDRLMGQQPRAPLVR